SLSDLSPCTSGVHIVRNRDAIRTNLLEEIARRRAEGTAGRSDILSLLVDARDEAGAPMSDAELLDEMFTLLMAGQETTATSLAWVFYHLLRHPGALANLRAELARVVGSGPVEAQHLPPLEYLDAVTTASARLTPRPTSPKWCSPRCSRASTSASPRATACGPSCARSRSRRRAGCRW